LKVRNLYLMYPIFKKRKRKIAIAFLHQHQFQIYNHSTHCFFSNDSRFDQLPELTKNPYEDENPVIEFTASQGIKGSVDATALLHGNVDHESSTSCRVEGTAGRRYQIDS
jgi:hypothetical protein